LRKRSGPARQTAQHNQAKTLFIDCSIGKHPVGALRSAGANVVHLDDIFPQNTPDEEWLTEAGKQGWIVLTKDKGIRYKPNEITMFKKSGVVAVVLVSGNMKREEMAKLLCESLKNIFRAAGKATPPAMFALTRDGKLNQKF